MGRCVPAASKWRERLLGRGKNLHQGVENPYGYDVGESRCAEVRLEAGSLGQLDEAFEYMLKPWT